MSHASATIQELLDGHPYVPRDLPQQNWRDVSPGMKRDSCSPPVGMSELSMRPPLAHANKSQPFKQRDDCMRLEDGDGAQDYATWMVWTPTNSDSSFGSPSSSSIPTTS